MDKDLEALREVCEYIGAVRALVLLDHRPPAPREGAPWTLRERRVDDDMHEWNAEKGVDDDEWNPVRSWDVNTAPGQEYQVHAIIDDTGAAVWVSWDRGDELEMEESARAGNAMYYCKDGQSHEEQRYREDPIPFTRNFVPVFAAVRAGLPPASAVCVKYSGETICYSEAEFLAIK